MQPTGFASLRSACQRLMPTLGRMTSGRRMFRHWQMYITDTST